MLATGAELFCTYPYDARLLGTGLGPVPAQPQPGWS